MAIEVGNVFTLKRRLDRVKGYGPDKVAYSDFAPIEKGAKVTILEIRGDRAYVHFERTVRIVDYYAENEGWQEIEIGALYNATDVYDKSYDLFVCILHRLGLLLGQAREKAKVWMSRFYIDE